MTKKPCYLLWPINYVNYHLVSIEKRVKLTIRAYSLNIFIFNIAEYKKITSNMFYIKQELNSFTENKK